jgi:hypothetical protein
MEGLLPYCLRRKGEQFADGDLAEFGLSHDPTLRPQPFATRAAGARTPTNVTPSFFLRERTILEINHNPQPPLSWS